MAKRLTDADGRIRAMYVTLGQNYTACYDTSTGGGDDDGYRLTIRAYAVSCEPYGSKVRNITSTYDFPHRLQGSDLDGLMVECYARRKDGGQVLSFECMYKDLIQVKPGQARGMVKTFAAIERGLLQDEQREGYHVSAGQYIARVGRALGATKIVLCKADADNRWGNYDDNEHRRACMSLGEGVTAINARVNAWAGGAQEQTISL
jgi:hypothetical protein